MVEFDEQRRPTAVWWPGSEAAGVNDESFVSLLHDMPTGAITHMQIDRTSVTDAGLAQLPMMPELASLWISKPLTGGCFQVLSRFPKFRSLEARGVRWSAQDAAALAKLPMLEWLILSGDDLESAAVTELAKLESVSGLQLVSYTKSNASAESFARLVACSKLELLDLSGQAIDDRTLEKLVRGLPELRRLIVGRTKVTDASMAAVRTNQRLTNLDLSDTKVTTRGLASLEGLPNLDSLDLDGTDIGDEAVSLLSSFPKLGTLCLNRTRVTESGVERLQALHAAAHPRSRAQPASGFLPAPGPDEGPRIRVFLH